MQLYGITCKVYGNLMAIVEDKIVNMLPVPGELFGGPPENLEKEVGDPSGIVDFTESLFEEVVGNPPRSLIEI